METNQSLEINKAFKFYFRDKDWLNKTLIGGLLVLSIIGNFAVMGWALRIQRREVDGDSPLVPRWDDLGEKFVLGLKYFLVSLVWNLPFVLLFSAGNLYILSLWSGVQSPYAGFDPQAFAWLLIAQPLIWLSSVFGWAALGVGSGLLAENFSLREAFNLRRGFSLLRLTWKHFLGAGFLGWVASYGASILGVPLLIIGVAFLSVPALAIRQNLYGQAFRIARAKVPESVNSA